ncbi:MAG TPA: phosphoglycerate dehydrogenase [Planctomycetaceae bacterium]|nr:phosphoglycerate dehydrogenase [Planctomycetaceae bacterium]
MPKVVMTAKMSKEGPHNKIFADAGFAVAYPPPDRDPYHEDTLIDLLKDAQAVVAGSEPFTPRVIESLPKLRVIVRAGVGFDAVNLPACDKAQIPVCITPGVNHHAVAEHTISLLMAIARGFPLLDQKVRKNIWDRISYPRVMGKTLGILGLGRIGQAVATRAVGLGMHVVAYEQFPDPAFVKKWNIEIVDLNTLLARSEYVSMHLPMSDENHHILNRERFAKMKKGVMVVNTARGPLINEADLIDALKSRHVAAAGLDVFEVEPLSLDSPLMSLDNVLLSGHVAGLDNESAYDTSKMCAELIVGFSQGRWPDGCVQNMKSGHAGWKW